MENPELLELHAIVSGEVQGVGFRATTHNYANRLGINGTVRNLPDGTVEIYAQGSRADLEMLLRLLQQTAAFSSITSISAKYYLPKQRHDGFWIV